MQNLLLLHLREQKGRQLEYFSYCKSMLELKDKRVQELVNVIKLYIKEEARPKQTSKPKKPVSKK